MAVGYLLSKISTKQLQRLIGSGGGGFDLQKAVRPNIMALKPYVCARDDYTDGKIRNAACRSNGFLRPTSEQGSSSMRMRTVLVRLSRMRTCLRGIPAPTNGI